MFQNNTYNEFLFYRSKAKGHGSLARQNYLIKHLIKLNKKINIITLEKDLFSPLLKANIINICFKEVAIKFSYIRWVFLLFTTVSLLNNYPNKSYNLIAFSDYESIIFRLAIYISKFLNLIKLNFLGKGNHNKVIFFSRGDIVDIFETNHSNKNLIKIAIINLIILYYKTIQHLAISCSTTYVVQMNFLKKQIKKRHNPKKFIYVLRNNIIPPLNCKNLKFKKNQILNNKLTISKRVISIGFAAPLRIRVKSLDIFIRIVNELNKNFQIKVITAGQGTDENYFISNIKNIVGKENHKHLGWLNSLETFYRDIDLLIIPSRYDSCPNFLLESIAVDKIKIIASDIPSHREILIKNMLLFPLNDINKTLKKIENLLEIPHEKYLSHIRKIRRNYTFNWEDEASKIIFKDL